MTDELIPPLIGLVVVVAAALIALLPLVRPAPAQAPPATSEDAESQRFRIYRQVLELELDYQTGKLSKDDLDALSAELLARATALLPTRTPGTQAIEDEVEREIAAARRAFATQRRDRRPARAARR